MNVGQVEGLLVLTLFLGYLYLWWQKKVTMGIRGRGIRGRG